jgi:cell division protein FtsI/penicillin-binding protein 2
LTDRAYQSAYPTGSVFKPITALAALQEGRVERDAVAPRDATLMRS